MFIFDERYVLEARIGRPGRGGALVRLHVPGRVIPRD
jgi:hypothetical protein